MPIVCQINFKHYCSVHHCYMMHTILKKGRLYSDYQSHYSLQGPYSVLKGSLTG